eukprot:scaffold24136_cov69-Phaeocystis_antarctica.AAC.2
MHRCKNPSGTGFERYCPPTRASSRYKEHAGTDVAALVRQSRRRGSTARCALCDREGSSRIGRRSREIIVPSISNVGTWWATRPT